MRAHGFLTISAGLATASIAATASPAAGSVPKVATANIIKVVATAFEVPDPQKPTRKVDEFYVVIRNKSHAPVVSFVVYGFLTNGGLSNALHILKGSPGFKLKGTPQVEWGVRLAPGKRAFVAFKVASRAVDVYCADGISDHDTCGFRPKK